MQPKRSEAEEGEGKGWLAECSAADADGEELRGDEPVQRAVGEGVRRRDQRHRTDRNHGRRVLVIVSVAPGEHGEAEGDAGAAEREELAARDVLDLPDGDGHAEELHSTDVPGVPHLPPTRTLLEDTCFVWC